MESETRTLKYTFTVTQIIEVRVQEGEGADERALKEAERIAGHDIYWNDVAEMEIEEAA